MIDQSLIVLRDLLNGHLRAQSGDLGESTEEEIVFLDGDKLDPIGFPTGAVSLLLVNVEADNTLPQADPFRRSLADGTKVPVTPELRLNLYVLFVARYKQYEVALARLSSILQYFQGNRVIDQEVAPALGPGIGKLVPELVTMTFGGVNEIWSALRTTYHPSILYRVRLIRMVQDDPVPGPEILEVVTSLSQ